MAWSITHLSFPLKLPIHLVPLKSRSTCEYMVLPLFLPYISWADMGNPPLSSSRNGSATNLEGTDLVTYPMFGSSSNTMALSDFITKLQPYAIPDLGTWCNVCNNTQTRGCDVIAAANSTSSSTGTDSSSGGYSSVTSTTGKQHVSPVVAGVIGAVVGLVFAALFMVGMEMWRKRKGRGLSPYRAAAGGGGGGAPGGARDSSHLGDSVSAY